MSARRFVLFLYFLALLILFIPKDVSYTFSFPTKLPKADFIQLDTPAGSYAIDRLPLDFLVLPYSDAYNRLIAITYSSRDRMFPVDLNTKVELPLGFCVLLDRLDRGHTFPSELEGVYTSPNKFPVNFTNIRFFSQDNLTAFTHHILSTHSLAHHKATPQSLKEEIDKNGGVIYLMNSYYPVYLYSYDSSAFYVYDPVTRTKNTNVIIESGNKLVYRAGLLTYIGGEQIHVQALSVQ